MVYFHMQISPCAALNEKYCTQAPHRLFAFMTSFYTGRDFCEPSLAANPKLHVCTFACKTLFELTQLYLRLSRSIRGGNTPVRKPRKPNYPNLASCSTFRYQDASNEVNRWDNMRAGIKILDMQPKYRKHVKSLLYSWKVKGLELARFYIQIMQIEEHGWMLNWMLNEKQLKGRKMRNFSVTALHKFAEYIICRDEV